MSKCPKSPNGFHQIRKGPFSYNSSKSLEENQKDFEKWKRNFHPSDQFCLLCREAIW